MTVSCTGCGIPVRNAGLCYLCVASLVEKSKDRDLANRKCGACGAPLPSQYDKDYQDHTISVWWRGKGGTKEHRIHKKCLPIAERRATFSREKPMAGKNWQQKNWDQRSRENREEKMKLTEDRARRMFIYFPKGDVGAYIVGKVTKAYRQKPNEFRTRETIAIEMSIAVDSKSSETGIEVIEVTLTDGHVGRAAEKALFGPGNIIGQYLAAFVHGVNEGGYNEVSVHASGDFKELIDEMRETEEYARLVEQFPSFDVGEKSFMTGPADKIAKFKGEKSDDIPF